MSFDHSSIEKKWQQKWEKGNLSAAADDSPKEKFYVLVEFPYPSGDGLHVGHCRSYTALDAVARKKRMEGKNVLFPIGFDAFGLPTENYAIKNKIQPRVATDKNIANFTKQLKSIGFSFDWNRVIDTTDPKYFKWTQWIFLQFFKKGLAYQAEIPINWCLSCKIGLANEEVVDGKCERCGGEIERRVKKQWMLAITKYADRLLQDLETVDYLPRIKTQQQNWIGRSEGASVQFSVNNVQCAIEVFTTRPDTLFGCTYTVLAPEHELLQKLKPKIKNWKEVEKYIQEAANKSDLERGELNKEKTGVELKGVRAINPVNGEEIPIFVADYVLAGYGTGAIMAVPAHDERDFEFATKFGIEIKYVIFNTEHTFVVEKTDSGIVDQKFTYGNVKDEKQAKWMEQKLIKKNKPQTLYGLLLNSGEFTGLHSSGAIPKIIEFLEEKKAGKSAVNFKLRDWIFSRQRYWGEPIPIVHCEKCGTVPAVADFAKYLQKKKGEDVLSKQASTGGSTQVCRID
ncbi:class I tRNA ligase family protein, partial [Patescibacteria group bacterium]|nr:class I tRNA ligase family protein [Patescibacteria group bacterium]